MKAWRKGIGLRGINHGDARSPEHGHDKEEALDHRKSVRIKSSGDPAVDRQRVLDRLARVDEKLAQLDAQPGGQNITSPEMPRDFQGPVGAEPAPPAGRQIGEDWHSRVTPVGQQPAAPAPVEPPPATIGEAVKGAVAPGVGLVAAGMVAGIVGSCLTDMLAGVDEAIMTPLTTNPDEIVPGTPFVDNVKAPTLNVETPQAPTAPAKEEEAPAPEAPKGPTEQQGIQWFKSFESGSGKAPAPTQPTPPAMPGITGP